MKITNYLCTLLAIEKQINASKETLLVNYQNNCQNSTFEETWFNKTGFGVENKFGTLDYYNYKQKEVAIVKIGEYIMEFGFVKVDNKSTILNFNSNKDNYFTRYIGNWFTNSNIKNTSKQAKINNMVEFYKKWFSKYKNYDVFSW